MNWERMLRVERIAWRNREAFSALMDFLWAHRGQCATIEWNWPAGEFIPAAMNEPRIDRKPHYYWMARPIDVRTLLSRRAALEGFRGTLSFGLTDPAAPTNSGRYTVENETVRFEPGDARRSPGSATHSSSSSSWCCIPAYG